MSRKSRLSRYKNHAKEGKLDNPDALTEEQESANSASTPNGSANPARVTLSHLTDGNARNAELRRELSSMMRDIVALVESRWPIKFAAFAFAMSTELGEGIFSTFNPHFRNCRCDSCKECVELVKSQILATDEYGEAIVQQ